jgi:hypothetical protein
MCARASGFGASVFSGAIGTAVRERPDSTGDLVADTRRLTAHTRRARPERRPVQLPNVLSIGLAEDAKLAGVAQLTVQRPQDIIEMLRVLHFDLLVVSASACDVPTWHVLALMHRHWPELHWVLLADEKCTDQDEIRARSLGATCVTTDLRAVVELATGEEVAPDSTPLH